MIYVLLVVIVIIIELFLNSIIMVVTSMKNLHQQPQQHHHHYQRKLASKTQNVLLSPFWRPPLQSKGQICIRLIMDSDLRSGGAAWNSSLNGQAKPSHMGEKTNKRKGPRHYWETPPTAEENNGRVIGFHRNCGSNRTSMCLIGSRAALPTKSNKSFVRISCAKKPWVELSFCQGQPCMVMAQGSSILERHADDPQRRCKSNAKNEKTH